MTNTLKTEIRQLSSHRRRQSVRPCRHLGHTVIEIIVVIAIVIVLFAIMLPALARSVRSAESGVCISNQKQLATAFNMYADDNDERYAPALAVGTPGVPTIVVGNPFFQLLILNAFDLTRGYYRDDRILLCPADHSFINWAATLFSGGFQAEKSTEKGSYAVNFSLFESPEIDDELGFVIHPFVDTRSESDVAEQSKTPMTYDSKYVELSQTNWDAPNNTDPNSSGYQYRHPTIPFGIGMFPGSRRHNNGTIVAFADTHAKWIPAYSKLPGLAPDPNYDIVGWTPAFHPPYDFNGIQSKEVDP